MKKSWLILISILSLNFASAYYYGYGGYSLGQMLDSIDPSTAILGAVFIILLIFINFSLSKTLKNPTISGIASLCISFLIVYFIHRNVDIQGLVYGARYSDQIILFFGFVLLVLLLLSYLKWGIGLSLFIAGLISILGGITEFIEPNEAIILGVILIIIGLFVNAKWPKKKDEITIKGLGKK